ncbi:MAG: hypothetical protein OEW42_00730 [Acidimicrobiia bacterium]|nr:hypothetical protein [Acidimicrobiia bacterium]
MFYVHEVHSVDGRHEDRFEARLRHDWAPAVADGDHARLLHYLHLAHGSGPSYRVVTVTAVTDGAAWGHLVDRTLTGDLAPIAAGLDECRHDVVAKVLAPLPWSGMQEIDLSTVGVGGVDHDPVLFMEDTVWPREGLLETYVERSGAHYASWMDTGDEAETSLLQVEASFRTVWGAGARREIVLWQRVTRPRWMSGLLITEVPAELKAPGTWMHDGLELRDQWESRILRSARWSPTA